MTKPENLCDIALAILAVKNLLGATRQMVGENDDRILHDVIGSPQYYRYRRERLDSLWEFLDLRYTRGVLPDRLPNGLHNCRSFSFNKKRIFPMIELLSIVELVPEANYWIDQYQVEPATAARVGPRLWQARREECLPDLYRVFRIRLAN